jgi:hypothetical protein
LQKPVGILYHCNEEEKCNQFIEDNNYLIVSYEDGIWLGDGMYFWDNQYNANYWKNEKSRKNPKGSYSIVKVAADLSDLLDLTDVDIANKVDELWEECKKRYSVGENIKETLGFKLNFLYECFDKFNEKYKIIKVFGKYFRTTSSELFQYSLKDKSVEPFSAAKIIYSVRNGECILEREKL